MLSLSSDAAVHAVCLVHRVTSTTYTNAAVAVVVTHGLIKYLSIRHIDRLR